MNVVGLDLGHATVPEAEHWLADLPPVPGLVACTHLVRGARPRVAITLAVRGEFDDSLTSFVGITPPDDDTLTAITADHADRRAGRAVIYPGVALLTGTMSVEDVLAKSAIERIRVLGGPDAEPGTLVDTRDFVRPQWMEGRLTLVATAAPAGRIAPFEVPNPTPCCADHG